MLGLDQEREESGRNHVMYLFSDPPFNYVCLYELLSYSNYSSSQLLNIVFEFASNFAANHEGNMQPDPNQTWLGIKEPVLPLPFLQ